MKKKKDTGYGYTLVKDLQTGMKIIDDEHRELFRIVNQLLEACEKGEPLTLLNPIIAFLVNYVVEHFEHEEQLQELGGYPDIEAHRAFHERYRKELEEVLSQIPSDGPTVSDVVNLNGQIARLIDHVKRDDRKMCEFLKG